MVLPELPEQTTYTPSDTGTTYSCDPLLSLLHAVKSVVLIITAKLNKNFFIVT